MPSISVPTALLGAAAIGGVGSVASGVLGANAATTAAGEQAAAAEQASNNTLAMFNTTQANLKPYMTAGTGALSELQALTGTNAGGNPLTAPLTAPFQPTMSQLAQTPGYQFTLAQGEQATQNSFAAQGLASSGSALKGASQYAENLAATTYQQQFQNYLTQNAQIYGMLGGQASLGENAAATVGNQGLEASGISGNYLTQAGAATAAGTVGATNAITGSLSGLGSTASNTALMLALSNSGLFGSGASVGQVANEVENSYAL